MESGLHNCLAEMFLDSARYKVNASQHPLTLFVSVLATKDVVEFPGVKENQNIEKIVGVKSENNNGS